MNAMNLRAASADVELVLAAAANVVTCTGRQGSGDVAPGHIQNFTDLREAELRLFSATAWAAESYTSSRSSAR
jgi:hypothetical protein